MRLNKQEEEDSEVKDIFEKSRKTTRVTQNNDNYESDDDADEFHVDKPAKGSRAKSSMQLDEDDFDNETTVKPARGRGLFLFV